MVPQTMLLTLSFANDPGEYLTVECQENEPLENNHKTALKLFHHKFIPDRYYNKPLAYFTISSEPWFIIKRTFPCSGAYRIFIRTLTAKIIELECESYRTIDNLKQLIQDCE